MKVRCLCLLVLSFCALSLLAEDGGSIKGSVVYDGTPPELKPTTVADTAVGDCKCTTVSNESLLVDPANKGIKWSIVRLMIEPKDAPPKAAKNAQLDQMGCHFEPHVVISAPGESVDFLNGDCTPAKMGIMHNLHSTPYDFENKPFNLAHSPAEPVKTIKGSVYFTKPEIVEIKCDIHFWMKSFVVVHDPRYCAVTGADGKFEIKNVPPGKYKLNVMQEACGEKVLDVEVKAGAATDAGEVKMKKGK